MGTISLELQFQFLIGRIKTMAFFRFSIFPHLFQFLIGRIKTGIRTIGKFESLSFNSL